MKFMVGPNEYMFKDIVITKIYWSTKKNEFVYLRNKI